MIYMFLNLYFIFVIDDVVGKMYSVFNNVLIFLEIE